MNIFLEGIFPMMFLSYFLYIFYFLFLLIPILSQIFFLYIIKVNQLWKLGVTIFLTEGFIIALSNIVIDLINNNYDIPLTLSLLLLTLILTIISIFICKESNKIKIKKTLLFLSSYIINILILIFMILKFNLFT